MADVMSAARRPLPMSQPSIVVEDSTPDAADTCGDAPLPGCSRWRSHSSSADCTSPMVERGIQVPPDAFFRSESIDYSSSGNHVGGIQRLFAAVHMQRAHSEHSERARPLQRGVAVCEEASPMPTGRLSLSPNLRRPTRCVSQVDSFETDGGYIKLNQYRLMAEIGQYIAIVRQLIVRRDMFAACLNSGHDSFIEIGGYRVLQSVHNQGSYGIVKLAYSEQDKNLYALKVLDKVKLMKKFACFRRPPPRRTRTGLSVAPEPLAQVHREIAILKKLSHPNVVRLVEVLDDPADNYMYMVFEYVQRGSVMEIPTSVPLPESIAWSYLRDIIQGLEYLHFQKIVHRDIKPSNLLLTETGHIKIADFGVSSEFEGIDAFLSGTAGTPAFMAPEALQEGSDHFYSGRAQDIWALGITMHCFVFGQVPFWDAYVIALHKLIKTAPLVFPATPPVSDRLTHLIRGMLAKDPGLRLSLAEIKRHDWVTRDGTAPLTCELDNCQLVTVTDEEIRTCVRVIPRLDTLILVKAMGQRRRFGNPFRRRPATTQSVRLRAASADLRRDPPAVSRRLGQLRMYAGRWLSSAAPTGSVEQWRRSGALVECGGGGDRCFATATRHLPVNAASAAVHLCICNRMCFLETVYALRFTLLY